MDTSEDDHIHHVRRRGGKDSSDTENRPSFFDSDDDDDDGGELSKGKYQRVLRSTNGEDDSTNRRGGKEKKQMVWDVASKGKNKLKEKGNNSRKNLADNKENSKLPSSPKEKRNKNSDDGKDVAAVSDLTEEDDPTTDKDLDLESQGSPLKRRKTARGKKRTPRYHPQHHHDRKAKQQYGQASILRRIGISEGKDKMIWARRAFFMSTEKIFPGFIRQYEIASSRSRDPTGLKLRTSVPLKVCLLAHAFFLPLWFISFLMTQEYASKSLKPLHNYVHTCLTYVSVGTDVLRLYAGFASNDRDDMQLMALYWMATAILQTPMMCFIFATHCFSTSLLPFNVSVDILLGAILVLEIWFGFWQLKNLVSCEISLLHMARRMNTMSTLKSRERRFHPKVINDPDREPYVAWSQGSTDTDTTSSSEIGDEQGDSAGRRPRPRAARNIKRIKSRKKNTTADSIPPNEVSMTE